MAARSRTGSRAGGQRPAAVPVPSLASATVPRVWQGIGYRPLPDAALARPRRNVSTTVLQALNLLNGRFTLAQTEFFAERLQREAGDDPVKQVKRAFRLAFGRGPTEQEKGVAVVFIKEQGIAAFCRAMYNANEFLYVD